MSKRNLAVIGVALLLAARAAWAEENAVAQRIAPFVEAQSVGVLHADMAGFNADAAEALVLNAVKQGAEKGDEGSIQAGFREVRRWVADFKAAGGRHIYVVVNPSDMPNAPGFIIAPLEQGGNGEAVASLLFSGRKDGPREAPGAEPNQFPGVTSVINGCVFMGTRATLARLKDVPAAQRPELTEALNAAGSAPFQAVLIPSADTRKVVEGVMPNLPQELGGGPTTVLTQGLVWAVLSGTLEPQASLKVIVQCKDKAAAQGIREVAAKAAQAATDAMPAEYKGIIGRVMQLLVPKVEDQRLVSALDQQQVSQAFEAMAGPLAMAREQARRVQSANNVKQLLLACYMYADDHKGEWPENLEALSKNIIPNASVFVNPRQPEAKRPYVYIRPADPKNVSPDLIVIHESPEGLKDGVNVGFGDGHVEWMRMDEFLKRVPQAKK